MKPQALSASTLNGTNVKNMEGENIGSIHDLMIDLKSGQVLYAVLSHGGFLGMGNDFFAVPMEAFVFSNKDEKVIRLDIDKDVLEKAPGFDKDNWPLQSTNDFTNSVYKHYGYKRNTPIVNSKM